MKPCLRFDRGSAQNVKGKVKCVRDVDFWVAALWR